MSNTAKWVIGIIVVAAIVAVLWFAFGQQTAMTPEAPATGGTTAPAPAPAPADGGTTGGTGTGGTGTGGNTTQ
jgi:hypothetical protein